jgi:hypothetical protein
MTPPLGAWAPALTASTLPPLSVWPCGPPWRVGKHKGAQTAIGPSQSPSRSLGAPSRCSSWLGYELLLFWATNYIVTRERERESARARERERESERLLYPRSFLMRHAACRSRRVSRNSLLHSPHSVQPHALVVEITIGLNRILDFVSINRTSRHTERLKTFI